MKTYQEWEDSNLDLNDFIKQDDEIDYELYSHILFGECRPNYDDGNMGQCGVSEYVRGYVEHYSTVLHEDGKYFYLGILPDYNKLSVPMKTNKFCSPPFKVGDPVRVYDGGLIALEKFAPKGSFPNNYGRIEEIFEQHNEILVEFPLLDADGKLGYTHSQVAPYNKSVVSHRELLNGL